MSRTFIENTVKALVDEHGHGKAHSMIYEGYRDGYLREEHLELMQDIMYEKYGYYACPKCDAEPFFNETEATWVCPFCD